jgi:hypothetical protein
LKEEFLASAEATGIKHTVHLGSPWFCCNIIYLHDDTYDQHALPMFSAKAKESLQLINTAFPFNSWWWVCSLMEWNVRNCT